jgi:4-hydroxy-4-methyl-2-oxoglutarate aldolase
MLRTPYIADACVRLGEPVRCAPHDLKPVRPGLSCCGPARPVRHFGSVDVFLEALETSAPGDVLVVDNEGRRDEGCVGDLITLETKNAGLSGLLIWGTHRDTEEITALNFPVFSLGSVPNGPLRTRLRFADPFAGASVGEAGVGRDDMVIADSDGAIFVRRAVFAEVVACASRIRDVELAQAERMRAGSSFRDQVEFHRYLERRTLERDLNFRTYLKEKAAAIEE